MGAGAPGLSTAAEGADVREAAVGKREAQVIEVVARLLPPFGMGTLTKGCMSVGLGMTGGGGVAGDKRLRMIAVCCPF